GDIAGGWFGFSRKPFRRDEFDAVSVAEITERAVGRDDFAARRRNALDRRLDLTVERVELSEIGCGIGLEDFFLGRIDCDQPVPNIADIKFGVRDRLPGVWVAHGMILCARGAARPNAP